MVSRELNLPSFSGVAFAIGGTISLSQAVDQKVIVHGDDALIGLLETPVAGDVLKIRFPGPREPTGGLDFDIQIPHVRHLGVLGAGSILGRGQFDVSNVELSVQGSGGIDLQVVGHHLSSTLSGSGALTLAGYADRQTIELAGSGDHRSYALTCKEAGIRISGSGDVQARVTDRLAVRITGNGNVYYAGDPVLDVKITGSGRIIRVSESS